MFSPLIVSVMGFGGLVFLAGAVIANVAVWEKAARLNSKFYKHQPLRWWASIGGGATRVIREYRQQAWKDNQPETRLRLGYRFVAVGLVTLFGASVLGNYLRGTL